MRSAAKLRSLQALGFASVIAPAVLFGAYAWMSYIQAFHDAEVRATRLTTILEEHTHRVFETMALALRLADQQLEGLDWDTIRTSRSLWEDLRKIQAAAPQIDSIFVHDPRGDSAVTTRQFPAPRLNFSDRDNFSAQKERDAGLFVSQAYIGKIAGYPIFNISIRRSAPGTEFNGVVGSSANVEYFRNFYGTVGDPADEFSVVLIHADGSILARYPDFTVGDKFDPAILKELTQQGSIYGVSPVDGLPRLYAIAKAHEFPVYVSYSIQRASILNRWAKGLITSGILTFGVAISLLFMASVALRRARAETDALRQLEQTAASLRGEIEARSRAEASLLQAQRLDAVGQMTSGIAHDFNNLLMVNLGNIDIALRQTDSARIRRLLKAARDAAERGSRLVRQLLAFSRSQQLLPEVVNLNELLVSSRPWIRRATSEAIEIELDCASDLWLTQVDVGEFEAALLNLAVNARDAMNGKGKLTLRTRNVTLKEDEKRQAFSRGGDCVQVSVTDTGSGMPPDVLARIYEPFFTTKEVGKGSGLGLSQVHGFVRQSGGDISVESQIGKGTTVTMLLPRCEAAARERHPAQKAPAPANLASPGKVVLVVDDDDEVRKIDALMLDELGYLAICARSGSEALALLSAGERIDVLLTDMILPRGMTGPELLKKGRDLRPNLPALLTTATPGTSSEFPVLRKPFTKQELAQALESVIDSRVECRPNTGQVA